MPANAWCFSILDKATLNKYYSGDVVEGIKAHASDLLGNGYKNLSDRILAQLV